MLLSQRSHRVAMSSSTFSLPHFWKRWWREATPYKQERRRSLLYCSLFWLASVSITGKLRNVSIFLFLLKFFSSVSLPFSLFLPLSLFFSLFPPLLIHRLHFFLWRVSTARYWYFLLSFWYVPLFHIYVASSQPPCSQIWNIWGSWGESSTTSLATGPTSWGRSSPNQSKYHTLICLLGGDGFLEYRYICILLCIWLPLVIIL